MDDAPFNLRSHPGCAEMSLGHITAAPARARTITGPLPRACAQAVMIPRGVGMRLPALRSEVHC